MPRQNIRPAVIVLGKSTFGGQGLDERRPLQLGGGFGSARYISGDRVLPWRRSSSATSGSLTRYQQRCAGDLMSLAHSLAHVPDSDIDSRPVRYTNPSSTPLRNTLVTLQRPTMEHVDGQSCGPRQHELRVLPDGHGGHEHSGGDGQAGLHPSAEVGFNPYLVERHRRLVKRTARCARVSAFDGRCRDTRNSRTSARLSMPATLGRRAGRVGALSVHLSAGTPTRAAIPVS